MTKRLRCICGMGGYPIGAISCPKHGYKRATNGGAFALGQITRGGFRIRRIVWGMALAREERRAFEGERIRRAMIKVRNVDAR